MAGCIHHDNQVTSDSLNNDEKISLACWAATKKSCDSVIFPATESHFVLVFHCLMHFICTLKQILFFFTVQKIAMLVNIEPKASIYEKCGPGNTPTKTDTVIRS